MNHKIWYVPHPTHIYNEDIISIAIEAGVSIVDANYSEDRTDEWLDAPKLTLKSDAPKENPVRAAK